MLGVQRDPGFDVDVVAGLAVAEQCDHVADFPLDRDVGDQALLGLGVRAGHASGVGVAVGVAVADVEVEHEVLLAAGVQVGGEGGRGFGERHSASPGSVVVEVVMLLFCSLRARAPARSAARWWW